MARILRMRKRGFINAPAGRAVPVVPSGNSEHIVRYPRIERGIYFADFMRDKRIYPEVYHCVIQREGSKEILSWTQHYSLEEAMKAAEETFALIAGRTAAAS